MKKLLMVLCLLPLTALAHSKVKHSLTETAKAAVKAATTAVVSAAVAAPGAVAEGAAATQKVDFWAIMKASAGSHLHSKIVHFPVALGLVGVFFGLLAYKFEGLRSNSRWLIFLAALASVFAILAGRAEEGNIEGALARQVLEGHEAQGYITCGLLWLNWILGFFESARKWSWAFLVFLGVVISFTAMLGGALAHMQF